MIEFADWLASTALSEAIVTNLWAIPAIQSVHILAIGLLVGALLMLDMRILGVLSKDQTIVQVNARYAPWIWGTVGVLALTGILLVFGEPRRELLSFSFWAKMTLLAIGIAIVCAFQVHLRNNAERWSTSFEAEPLTRFFAVLSIFVWVGIIFLGRFIAWDADIFGGLFS